MQLEVEVDSKQTTILIMINSINSYIARICNQPMALIKTETEAEGNAIKAPHFIQETPGCHLRQIRKGLSISMDSAQYHLSQLEKMGRVSSVRRGLYKFYFPAGVFQNKEKSVLEVLSHETTRDLLMLLSNKEIPLLQILSII